MDRPLRGGRVGHHRERLDRGGAARTAAFRAAAIAERCPGDGRHEHASGGSVRDQPLKPSTDLARLVRCHHRPEISTVTSMARCAAGDQTGTSRSSARDAPGVARALQLLGKRVRTLRLAGKLTQEQAAESAKLDENHWQAIEAGRTNPTVASLVGVARALDVPLAKLFESGNEMERSQASQA